MRSYRNLARFESNRNEIRAEQLSQKHVRCTWVSASDIWAATAHARPHLSSDASKSRPGPDRQSKARLTGAWVIDTDGFNPLPRSVSQRHTICSSYLTSNQKWNHWLTAFCNTSAWLNRWKTIQTTSKIQTTNISQQCYYSSQTILR